MRSVRRNRQAPSSPRAKAGCKSARASRDGYKSAGDSRRAGSRGGIFSRSLRHIAGWFVRPMALLTVGTVCFALIAALLASGIAGRAAGTVRADFAAVLADAGFGISEIHIAGNNRTQPETILAALGFAPGQSIFAADLVGARARLMALDWIASADVRRRYPDAISVTLVEKRPFALWQSPPNANGESVIAVVERSGGIITTRDVERFAHLPKLLGAGAPQAGAGIVDAVMAHRAVAARVRMFERQSDRRWNLILDDGVTVKLPETDWQKQIDVLEHLIVDDGVLERDVSEIDLRSPTHYFFVLNGGGEKTVRRGDKI